MKRETGLGFRDLVRAARLRKRNELLTTTFLSVKEVAALSGYSRPNELTRDFKPRFPYLPSAVRLTLRAEQASDRMYAAVV